MDYFHHEHHVETCFLVVSGEALQSLSNQIIISMTCSKTLKPLKKWGMDKEVILEKSEHSCFQLSVSGLSLIRSFPFFARVRDIQKCEEILLQIQYSRTIPLKYLQTCKH